LIKTVREQIGAIATIAEIRWAETLPKTRSGKIMRRLLRKIATNDTSDLGDLSTLADPSVVDALLTTNDRAAKPSKMVPDAIFNFVE